MLFDGRVCIGVGFNFVLNLFVELLLIEYLFCIILKKN